MPSSFVRVRPEDGYSANRNISPMQCVLIDIRCVVSTELALGNEMDLLQGRLRGGDKDGDDDDVCIYTYVEHVCIYVYIYYIYIHSRIYMHL
jgi:hypothetical protein